MERIPPFKEVLKQKIKKTYQGPESKMAKAPTTWDEKKEHKDKHQVLKPGSSSTPIGPVEKVDKIEKV